MALAVTAEDMEPKRTAGQTSSPTAVRQASPPLSPAQHPEPRWGAQQARAPPAPYSFHLDGHSAAVLPF